MKSEQLHAIKTSLVRIHVVIQDQAELNLATFKLLHQRMSIVESAVGVLLPSFEAGREETAQVFKDRIAKIETHHEHIGERLAHLATLLGGLGG